MSIIILPWSISTLGYTGAACGSRCSIPSSCQSYTQGSQCPPACEPGHEEMSVNRERDFCTNLLSLRSGDNFEALSEPQAEQEGEDLCGH